MRMVTMARDISVLAPVASIAPAEAAYGAKSTPGVRFDFAA